MALALVIAASDSGKRPELLLPTARRVLHDPWLCASIGVVTACASAPLVWPHYFLLNLLPIAWLLKGRARWDFGSTCAALSFAVQSKPLILALAALKWTGVIHVMMFYTWVPLVPALLLAVVQRRSAPGAIAPQAANA
jgi:hypothetical protein